MPGPILTTLSTAQCPHGGMVQLTTTANAVVQIDGGYALLESDIHTVTGCSFNISGSPSPCVMVQWSGGSTQVKINQVGVLTTSSIGQCIGAGVQGVAIISNTQSDAATTA
jgi:hypothetical protein